MRPTTTKKVKANTTTKISNRVDLSSSQPIPFEGGKAFSYVNNTEYLPFLSPDDNYGQQLLESRLLSVTHNRCITTKKDYCAGLGFEHTEGQGLDKAFIEWQSSINLKNEPATEVNKQIFESFFTWGNNPIELVRFTVSGKRHFFVYSHNFLEWRLAKPDGDDIVQEAIQSKLFLRANYIAPEDLKEAKKLPIYNPRNTERQNWKKIDGTERTLIWYKHSVSGFNYYGIPSNVSSIIYQILEYKGARYNLDNFENNMVVSALLALKGNLGQTEADRIGKKIIQAHTGDGKRGRVVVIASEEGINSSQLHNMDTHKEGSFNESDNLWSQKIITSNDWDSVMLGILSPSTLGKGSGFITKILERILNTVIRPAQDDIMQKVWKHVLRLSSEWIGFKVDIDKLTIKNSIDISGLTDVDITPAVTRNEVRKAKGLPEDTTPMGKEYMKSTGPQNLNPQTKQEDNVQP